MLPGLDINVAALGFKNQGQFIAAVHVSNNLGIPFVDLKSAMVDDGLSLGRAIQRLRPAANGEVESTRATTQARVDIRETETTTTKTTTTTRTKTASTSTTSKAKTKTDTKKRS
jgi:hypothetical protein